MTRPVLVALFAALVSTAASAGTVSVVKRDAVQPVSKYAVAANLNKLVFWHVPSRDDAAKLR